MSKYATGYSIQNNINNNKLYLNTIAQVKDVLHDVHFAHYNNAEIASGRFVEGTDPEATMQFVQDALTIGIRPTLLINYLINKDYKKIMEVFDEMYYQRGLRSVVVADIELIKRLSDKYSDLYIQGSVLSYRSTEKELQEEKDAGVVIHNPQASIIRDPEQIVKNHAAGFKQKIMPFEGCYRDCIHEKSVGGHRWSIARNKEFNSDTICSKVLMGDMRPFFRANWVTTQRLAEIKDSIEVIKMPRGTGGGLVRRFIGSTPSQPAIVNMGRAVVEFIDIIENSKPYNIADFNAVVYGENLRDIFRTVPSELFDKEFFDITDKCGMRCEELGCDLCFRKAKAMGNYIIDKKKYEIRGVRIVKKY